MIKNVARVLHQLHEGALVEIRAIGVPVRGGKAIWSGYYTDYQLAAKAAAECEAAKAEGVYCTLNTIHPGLIARSPNILRKERDLKTTTDKEVLKHQWLLIDVDPIRPAGISSTAGELMIAKTVRDEICRWLVVTFPDHMVIKACSGNGFHCLLKASLSASEQGEILAAVDSFFGDDRVSIDKSVTKPAQLTKLYGTWARKGYSTADRPHRQSYIELVIEKKDKDEKPTKEEPVASEEIPVEEWDPV